MRTDTQDPLIPGGHGSNHCAKGRENLGKAENGWKEEEKAKIGPQIDLTLKVSRPWNPPGAVGLTLTPLRGSS